MRRASPGRQFRRQREQHPLLARPVVFPFCRRGEDAVELRSTRQPRSLHEHFPNLRYPRCPRQRFRNRKLIAKITT